MLQDIVKLRWLCYRISSPIPPQTLSFLVVIPSSASFAPPMIPSRRVGLVRDPLRQHSQVPADRHYGRHFELGRCVAYEEVASSGIVSDAEPCSTLEMSSSGVVNAGHT
jgi:hypothetical protein